MQEGFPFDISRPWGSMRQFSLNVSTTVKLITVNPNEVLSLQSHNKRQEFWRVISGSGVFEINGEKREVGVGSEAMVEIGAHHRVSAGGDGMQFLEIAFGEFDEEGDIVRYEDKYGRV